MDLETRKGNEHAYWIEQGIHCEAQSVSESLSGTGGKDSGLTLYTVLAADVE